VPDRVRRRVRRNGYNEGRQEMWKSNSDEDILDFALLWEPLGGPAPEDIAAAFSLDVTQYRCRLRAAARFQLARISEGVVCPERIYGQSAIAVLDRDSQQESGLRANKYSRSLLVTAPARLCLSVSGL